jgi:hypothetical protein
VPRLLCDLPLTDLLLHFITAGRQPASLLKDISTNTRFPHTSSRAYRSLVEWIAGLWQATSIATSER